MGGGTQLGWALCGLWQCFAWQAGLTCINKLALELDDNHHHHNHHSCTLIVAPLLFLQSTTRVKPFICTMPMRLDEGWNQIQFNLADFTRRAYGELSSLQALVLRPSIPSTGCAACSAHSR